MEAWEHCMSLRPGKRSMRREKAQRGLSSVEGYRNGADDPRSEATDHASRWRPGGVSSSGRMRSASQRWGIQTPPQSLMRFFATPSAGTLAGPCCLLPCSPRWVNQQPGWPWVPLLPRSIRGARVIVKAWRRVHSSRAGRYHPALQETDVATRGRQTQQPEQSVARG